MSGLPGESGQQPDPAERIETYLDELMLALRSRPREARRLLREAETHLRALVEAGLATGLDERQATEQALTRFGPPSAVARGLPSVAAYQTMLSQLTETALLVIGVLCLAAGAAAIPAAILGLAGNPGMVTGDRAGMAVTAARCQQLLHMVAAPSCGQALSTHHLEEVIRDHLLGGWVGVAALGIWWAWHVHRKTRPAVLPAGFSLTVCGTLLGAAGALLLAIGIRESMLGITAVDGVIGSGDLAATGATITAAALLCWAVLARQATRPARTR
jgi:hypothetical protein